MLYFSKIKITSILIATLLFTYFTISNFLSFDDDLFKKKINLGLDLQGGSYLLLEIDNEPVITQRLQTKLSSLRKYFKEENIIFKNLKIVNNKEKPYIFLFMSDQVPAKKSNGKRIQFLNQSTLVDKGAERISEALKIWNI